MELVKRILVDLHKSLKDSEEAGRRRLAFKRLDPFDFVTTKTNSVASPKSVSLFRLAVQVNARRELTIRTDIEEVRQLIRC
jgi:hypothetical protein